MKNCTTEKKIRLGIIGTNFVSDWLTTEAKASGLFAVCAVYSRQAETGEAYAKKHGIPAECLSPKEFASREEFNEALVAKIDSYHLDLIVLAGYLVKIPAAMIEKYRNKIINIHPSLIPSFCGKGYYGLNVHKAAIEYGVKISGLTVHFVDEHYDSGAILLQRAVLVAEDDTPETLQARILEEEHKALPEAVRLLTTGKVVKDGRKVRILI